MNRRILWCDAEANFTQLKDIASIANLINKAKAAKIDTLVIDIKPLSGEVLYNSSIAPRFKGSDTASYPYSFDLLQTVITEGHKAGIEIHAGINVFSEGHRQWNRGPAFEHPDWQATLLEPIRSAIIDSNSHIKIELFDPWTDEIDQPIIYTKKSGKSLNLNKNRKYITIIEDSVTDFANYNNNSTIQIPDNGCILSIPERYSLPIKINSVIEWKIEHILRKHADSLIPSWGLFVNPIGPAAAYELSVIDEIVSKYNIDGITLDRLRYPNIYADFSNISLRSFSDWIGHKDAITPCDILSYDAKPWNSLNRGPFFKQWLEWRAWQINNFATATVEMIRSHAKNIKIGVYVGSWYESYFDVGVNWGSQDNVLTYEWMTSDYHKTGYASLFDYICTGCYYPNVSKEDAKVRNMPLGATVEAACELSKQAILDSSKIYGSLYLKEYKDSPNNFVRAAAMAEKLTNGVMMFDLVYLDKYNWWHLLNSE